MILRKWTDDDTRWLKANFARLDVQKISYQLGVPLEEIQKRVKALKLVVVEPAAAARRPRPSRRRRRSSRRRAGSTRRRSSLPQAALRRGRAPLRGRRREVPGRKGVPRPGEDVSRRLPERQEDKRRRPGGRPEDLYHSAVFEKNRGNVEKALELLKEPGKRDGDGRLHYLAACCHALQGDVEQAIPNLRKAIAADDQNRIQARLDIDLAVLRGTRASRRSSREARDAPSSSSPPGAACG